MMRESIRPENPEALVASDSMTKVAFVFKINENRKSFDGLVDDLDYRCVQSLRNTVKNLRSFRDYEKK